MFHIQRSGLNAACFQNGALSRTEKVFFKVKFDFPVTPSKNKHFPLFTAYGMKAKRFRSRPDPSEDAFRLIKPAKAGNNLVVPDCLVTPDEQYTFD
ncbi:hypothetical protein [Paenibacillus chitinolyticus]|uniref:hypothetical protein n=1 Tax=Paenibacillus chitinolyticus TaxID=79263 RepID=UPI001C4460E7|nr:hypothetical protein [Paenibacillus chitinolyticus]MBV6716891.1 hypothetical protein [Paenibacillus chitinolyticus]